MGGRSLSCHPPSPPPIYETVLTSSHHVLASAMKEFVCSDARGFSFMTYALGGGKFELKDITMNIDFKTGPICGQGVGGVLTLTS